MRCDGFGQSHHDASTQGHRNRTQVGDLGRDQGHTAFHRQKGKVGCSRALPIEFGCQNTLALRHVGRPPLSCGSVSCCRDAFIVASVACRGLPRELCQAALVWRRQLAYILGQCRGHTPLCIDLLRGGRHNQRPLRLPIAIDTTLLARDGALQPCRLTVRQRRRGGRKRGTRMIETLLIAQSQHLCLPHLAIQVGAKGPDVRCLQPGREAFRRLLEQPAVGLDAIGIAAHLRNQVVGLGFQGVQGPFVQQGFGAAQGAGAENGHHAVKSTARFPFNRAVHRPEGTPSIVERL